jgi:hypothetical protein
MEGVMKNPWMSAWLSAANRAAGTARGLWLAEARRQQNAAAKSLSKAGGTGAKKGSRAGRKPKGR